MLFVLETKKKFVTMLRLNIPHKNFKKAKHIDFYLILSLHYFKFQYN